MQWRSRGVRAAITPMSRSFAARRTRSSRVASVRGGSALLRHLWKRADLQHKLLPGLCSSVSGQTRFRRGCRITPFVFNQRPFAVHSLMINTLVCVLAGGEFLRCAWGVAIENGSKFPFFFLLLAGFSSILSPRLWMRNTFRYHIEARTMAECIGVATQQMVIRDL